MMARASELSSYTLSRIGLGAGVLARRGSRHIQGG